jgi:hypothetical protein
LQERHDLLTSEDARQPLLPLGQRQVFDGRGFHFSPAGEEAKEGAERAEPELNRGAAALVAAQVPQVTPKIVPSQSRPDRRSPFVLALEPPTELAQGVGVVAHGVTRGAPVRVQMLSETIDGRIRVGA